MEKISLLQRWDVNKTTFKSFDTLKQQEKDSDLPN